MIIGPTPCQGCGTPVSWDGVAWLDHGAPHHCRSWPNSPPCESHDRPLDAPRNPRLPGPTPAPDQRHGRTRTTATGRPLAGAPSVATPSVASAATRSQPQGRAAWLVALLVLAGLVAGAWAFGVQSTSTAAPTAPYNDPGGGPQYNGYVVMCQDGWISHSGGRQGACSHHGGVAR